MKWLLLATPKTNLRLDLFLLLLFLAVLVTGEGEGGVGHMILSLAITLGLGLHVIWHRRFLFTGLARRFWTGKARTHLLVDHVLLGTGLLTVGTGLLVSGWFGEPDSHLVHVHHVVPKLFFLALLVHLGQHARALKRWIPGRVPGG